MSIDWLAQWQAHAPNFANGHARIDLSLYGPPGSLRMLPGAGFGDTSHPTTRLVLRLMANCVQKYTLIDIGCGSGILSLAALLWGAKSTIGIDIDKEALEHAQRNCFMNGLSNAYFTHELSTPLQKPILITMNMISSEQRTAWSAHPCLHHIACPIITSGVLVSERQRYIEEVLKHRSWHLEEEIQEEEWLAFRFSRT